MSARPKQRRAQSPLPARSGVGASCVALPRGAWYTMLEFLCERFPNVSRDTWLERIERRELVDQCGVPVTEARPYQAQLRLYYYRTTHDEPSVPFAERIVHQDEELVVADKPHFLPVVPSGPYLHETLLVRLKKRLGIDTLVPIHRIDRETAGLVLFSARPATRDAYQRLFREQRIQKSYEAIVACREGHPLPRVYRSRLIDDVGLRMREVEGLPNTETHFQHLERQGALAKYLLRPVTGRKHQLRVHCMTLGAPIVGDSYYPELKPASETDFGQPLELLAKTLAFHDPLTGIARSFCSARSLSF